MLKSAKSTSEAKQSELFAEERKVASGRYINFVLIKATYINCEEDGLTGVNIKPFQVFFFSRATTH